MNSDNEVVTKKICKKCGTTIEDDAKFCPNCGTPIVKSKSSPKKRSHKLLIALLIIIGIGIIAIGGSNNETDSPKGSTGTREIDSTNDNNVSDTDKQSNQSNPIVSRLSDASDATDYVGDWEDVISQRCYMSIEDLGNGHYSVDIGWSGGASESTYWNMDAQYNSQTRALEYRAGTCVEYVYLDEVNYTENIAYTDGTGVFYISNNYLYWQDDMENIGENLQFEKPYYEEFDDYNLSEFAQKLIAEQNTQYMSVGQLVRNPNQYTDGMMYRFTGYVDGIERSESYSRAVFKVEDTAIMIYYPGWIEAIQGDLLTLYGYVNGIAEYHHSTRGTVQTAGVDVVYYTIGSSSMDCEFSEEQWDFITGDWYSEDGDRYIGDQITITKDTINGRPYTIRNCGINGSDLQTAFGLDTNRFTGQYLYLNYTGEAANGETINGGFNFYFDGRMSHSTRRGDTLYNLSYSFVDFHR